jgi:hypothetical protein
MMASVTRGFRYGREGALGAQARLRSTRASCSPACYRPRHEEQPARLPALPKRSKMRRDESLEATMANHSKERAEAEARFKKVQKAQRATEGSAAMSEYVAAGHAERAKTARLRELRLAKEAADKKDKTKRGK